MSTRQTISADIVIVVLPENDNAPIINATSYNRTIEEDYPPYETIITVVASDADRESQIYQHEKEATLSYSITDGDDAVPWFGINSTTGAIFAVRSLDRESPGRSFYNLTVVVSDGGILPQRLQSSVQVYIYLEDVNDNRPTFDQHSYTIFIPEDTDIDDVIDTRLHSTDPDRGINATSQYRIVDVKTCDGVSVSDFYIFKVDIDNGTIYLNNTVDRETERCYRIEFQTYDKGPPALAEKKGIQYFDIAQVTVIICDINDNVPQFTAPLYVGDVREDSRRGVSIVRVNATDGDLGSSCPTPGPLSNLNFDLRYSLVMDNTSDPFAIDAVSGIVSVDGPLDRETQDFYKLTVEVTDRGNPALTSTSIIEINITDYNDHDPVFNQTWFSVSVPENALMYPQGKEVYSILATFSATDDDIGPNAQIYYQITAGDTNNSFTVNRTTGAVTIVKRLNREAKDFYTLTITAFDSGVPQRSSDAYLNVTVTDANDSPPQFTQQFYSSEVAEYTRIGMTVLRVSATEFDLNENGEIEFSIIGRNDSSMFDFNSTSGEFTVNTNLCRNNNVTFFFQIEATDKAADPLQSYANASITIYDVNVNVPTITPPSVFIFEDPVAAGQAITDINATDADLCTGPLSYSLSGTDNSDFVLNSTTGELRAAVALQTNRIRAYNLTVTVTDSGSSLVVLRAQTTVAIIVGHRVLLSFSLSQQAGFSASSADFSTSPRQFSQSASLFTNLLSGQTGEIRVNFGQHLISTQSFQAKQIPAASVRAELLSETVLWPGMHSVRLAGQVKNSDDFQEAASATVFFQVRVAGSSYNQTCRSDIVTGTCSVHISLPDSVFSSSTSAITASVWYGLASGSLQLLPKSITLHQKRPVSYGKVTAVFPTASVENGEMFSVNVSANDTYQLTAFTMTVQFSSSFGYTKIVFDTLNWAVSTSVLSPTSILVQGTRKLGQPLWTVFGSSKQDLFNVQFDVKASTATTGRVTVAVNRLDSIISNSIWQGGVTHVWRDPLITTYGQMEVTAPRLVALFPYSDRYDLLNMYSLNNQAVIIPITLYSVDSLGRFSQLASRGSVTCGTTSATILDVTLQCQATLNANTVSAGKACIDVRSTQGPSAQVCFRVAVPTSLSISMADSLLSPISGWLSQQAGSCRQQYQSTTVTVWASFSFGTTTRRVDITSLVTITSDDVGVARIQGNRVVAVAPGEASISVQSSVGRPSAAVVVQAEPVTVLALEIESASEISFVRFSDANQNLTAGLSPLQLGRTALVKATAELQQSPLSYPQQPLYIQVAAVFSDGYRQVLTASDGLSVVAETPGVVNTSNPVQAWAVSSGSTNLTAHWQSSCGSGRWSSSKPGHVTVQLEDEPAAELQVTNRVIVPVRDLASGNVYTPRIPTVSKLSVVLAYNRNGNIFRKTMTVDSRTRVVDPTGRLVILRNSSGIFLSARTPVNAGLATLQVSFTHVNSTGSQNVTVAETTNTRTLLMPYPSYPGSSDQRVTTVHRLAGLSQWQLVLLNLSLLVEAGSEGVVQAYDIHLTRSSNSHFIIKQNLLNDQLRSHVLDIAKLDPGFSFTSNTSITITPALESTIGTIQPSVTLGVTVASVEVAFINRFNLTSGSSCRSSGTCQLVLGFTFSDGSVVEDLFNLPAGVPDWRGLFSFSSSAPSVLGVDNSNGRITSNANMGEDVVVTATSRPRSGPPVTATVRISSNVDPVLGDVDLGAESGLPVEAVTTGSNFTVPVRVNAAAAIGAVQITLNFDSTQLMAVSIRPAAGWLGGPFFSQLHSPRGRVRFGGVSLQGSAQPQLVHIADVTFQALKAGQLAISGTIDLLSGQPTTTNTAPLLMALNRPIVAGAIQVTATGTTVTPPMSSPSPVASTPRPAKCQAQRPCSCTSGRETGDLNTDCVFDLDDVALAMRYLQVRNTSGPQAELFRTFGADPSVQKILDANLDTVITMDDVELLAKINFGLAHFVTQISIVPIQENAGECRLLIRSQLVAAGNQPLSSSSKFLVNLASLDGNVTRGRSESNVEIGRKEASSPQGWFLEAAHVGNGSFLLQVDAAFVSKSIGYFALQVVADDLGQADLSRVQTMVGMPTTPLSFLPIDMLLQTNRGPVVQLYQPLGYNPLGYFTQNVTTRLCSNNVAPVFSENLTTVAIPETQPVESVIVTLTATDPDNFSTPISYFIRRGNEAGHFELNVTSGELSVVSVLDRESIGSYTLDVYAVDSGVFFSRRGTAVVQITILDINDNKPVFSQAVYSFLPLEENSRINTFVGQVFATDKDAGTNREIRFTLEAGVQNDDFTINSTTGVVRTARSLDYENLINYNLTVRATDLGSPAQFSEATILFSVLPFNDIAPACSPTFVSERIRVSIQFRAFIS